MRIVYINGGQRRFQPTSQAIAGNSSSFQFYKVEAIIRAWRLPYITEVKDKPPVG